MTYFIRYNEGKGIVQLLVLGVSGYEVMDESQIPKSFIHAPYLAIIKGAYLAIKNNILIYTMDGWGKEISTKIDEWFGKSFPLKFKYHNKDSNFWIKNSQELMDKSFLSNGFELLEKAIIFIFGAINRIYIDNPEAIQLKIEQNYQFETYQTHKPIEQQLEEFNLFSDASVRELEKTTTIAGLIKNKDNDILSVYRDKVSYEMFADSNLAEMLAITEGLKVALDMGIKKIKIFTDSMCAVEKLQKYSPYYKGLFSDHIDMIMEQVKQFKDCKIIHINRQHNKIADQMTHFS